jgi:3-phosphoshikimate 1-carboxyvinyltransferase
MQGGTATVDGSLSSQILTGLLIASPLAQKDTIFTVHKLQSKPYIDMTIQIMQDFGITVSHTNYETFSIACNQSYTPQNYVVEGDWSGASFHLVAGAIAGTITITNVRNDSKQADMALVEALRLAGAKIKLHNNSITISKQELNAFHFDATDCPDLFPPLVSLGDHCKGVTTIKV